MDRRYSRAERRALPKLHGPDAVIAVIKALVCDEHTEGQLVVGIDDTARLSGAAFRCPCERCAEQPVTDPNDLIALADELGAAAIVLTTFVPSERLAPTAADVARFEGWRVECRALGIELLDHLLFSGHQWRSVREVSPW